ncbi:px domain containing protein [Stylonychia lemnae]|uniref:Px domain containing protein n=1 Tax=Stylonychia lemnae TaxID=5949 RepID=A0A078AIW4_STYLE|nr:px domain containing protein [Stylonychia lemnae]|eukprot:CDW81866.1 px domain containing protein [Stylonychia lemnae]
MIDQSAVGSSSKEQQKFDKTNISQQKTMEESKINARDNNGNHSNDTIDLSKQSIENKNDFGMSNNVSASQNQKRNQIEITDNKDSQNKTESDFLTGLNKDLSQMTALRRQQSAGSMDVIGLRGLKTNKEFESNLNDEENEEEEKNLMNESRHKSMRVKPSTPNMSQGLGGSRKLLANDSAMNQLEGEFAVIKGYGKDDQSQNWSVNNPHKPNQQDHYVYTLNGMDSQGRIEVNRRFKEFHLLRQVFTQRFPGLYVPPIPAKKAMKNTDREVVEERAQILNLFIKQVVRCPYLFRSEELSIFIRPELEMKKALTLLPRLNFQENLERTQNFYSFTGEISDQQIQRANNKINLFIGSARRMHAFLDKFKEMVHRLEIGYDAQWTNHKQLNDLMGQYEDNNLKQYTETRYENFLLFRHPQKTEAKDILESLPNEIVNPFKVMKLWIKWEQLDIMALIDAVDAKSTLERERIRYHSKKTEDSRDLEKLRRGKKTLKTMFLTKKGQVDKITTLNQKVNEADKQIECFDLYYKIIVLQQLHSAIPFFKRDKIQIYNDLLETYSLQQIKNCQQISACYQKLMAANKQAFEFEDEERVIKITNAAE